MNFGEREQQRAPEKRSAPINIDRATQFQPEIPSGSMLRESTTSSSSKLPLSTISSVANKRSKRSILTPQSIPRAFALPSQTLRTSFDESRHNTARQKAAECFPMANHVAKTSDQDDDNDDVKSSDCNGSGDGKDQENDPGVSNHMITQPVDSCIPVATSVHRPPACINLDVPLPTCSPSSSDDERKDPRIFHQMSKMPQYKRIAQDIQNARDRSGAETSAPGPITMTTNKKKSKHPRRAG